mgnify:CR=1 FL=1
MGKNLGIILALVVIIALPFVFRREPEAGQWQAGDPVLTIITPHNEAIRYEFERGFSKWHQQRFGRPVKVDWRNIGGTTEINRYLTSEFAASTRAWWLAAGKPWPDGASDALVAARPPTDAALKEIYDQARTIDDPSLITTKIDLFFGGGEFDHSASYRSGYTVAVEKELPPSLFAFDDGTPLIPSTLSGETWRTPYLFGNAISTFGIVYNLDRLKQLGIADPPRRWDDLSDFRYFGQVGVADPTKSGSIAKAFEMLVHQKMHDRVIAAGFSDEDIKQFESAIARLGPTAARGQIPPDVPPAYQEAIERGWEDGMFLLQAIGANARYFTDSASKVPIDVSVGDAAVGMAIDFYGRYQAQVSRGPNGEERMVYLTPAGGSSVSCDPISLLRGAPNRQTAVRFIEFVLSEDGQRLWTYRPGTPGGPEKYALRRLPIRRDFYPSTQPAVQSRHEEHARYASDPLADPAVNPYQLAKEFTYYRRWTGDHFSVMRNLIRAMCLDSGEELRAAWRTIHASPDPAAGLAKIRRLPTVTLTGKDGARSPVPLNWRTAPDIRRNYQELEYMREWTAAFREQYRAIR